MMVQAQTHNRANDIDTSTWWGKICYGLQQYPDDFEVHLTKLQFHLRNVELIKGMAIIRELSPQRVDEVVKEHMSAVYKDAYPLLHFLDEVDEVLQRFSLNTLDKAGLYGMKVYFCQLVDRPTTGEEALTEYRSLKKQLTAEEISILQQKYWQTPEEGIISHHGTKYDTFFSVSRGKSKFYPYLLSISTLSNTSGALYTASDSSLLNYYEEAEFAFEALLNVNPTWWSLKSGLPATVYHERLTLAEDKALAKLHESLPVFDQVFNDISMRLYDERMNEYQESLRKLEEDRRYRRGKNSEELYQKIELLSAESEKTTKNSVIFKMALSSESGKTLIQNSVDAWQQLSQEISQEERKHIEEKSERLIDFVIRDGYWHSDGE